MDEIDELMSEVYRGTRQWFNPHGIKLRSIPVEGHGMFTSGLTFCEPWTIERAERTSETSSSYNTVTHDLDENVLKAKLNELVFARA